MSVTGSTTRNDYSAASGQTVFAYTFQILLTTDVKVIKNGTTLTIDNDYAVSGAGVSSGGNVTLTSGASGGDTVSILLAMPIDRTTQYQNAGDFLASDVNGDLDKSYIALNQLQTDVSRAVRLKDQDQSVDLELPLVSTRANKFLRFNFDGSVDVTTGTPGAPSTTDDITYNSGETGSTQRTLTSRLKDFLLATDFGVVGDGVADDTTAARNCILAAIANDKVAYFPEGNYKITANILDYKKLVDGGKSPKIVGAGRGLTKFTISGTQTNYVFSIYGDTTSYGNSSHPSGILLQGFSVIGDDDDSVVQNIFDLAMLSYFTIYDVNTFQCSGVNLRMRECWEGHIGLKAIRGGATDVYPIICDYYFLDKKSDSACNNLHFGKDFQCEAPPWSAMFWGRNTRKVMMSGKIHPRRSLTYTVPAIVMQGATNNTMVGANISWKNVKSIRIEDSPAGTDSNGSYPKYSASENVFIGNTIAGGFELKNSCRRNTIAYNVGGIPQIKDNYDATASQTVFAYTFQADDSKNVQVLQNNDELTLTTDYTLSGIGSADGGNVTLVVGAAAGDNISIRRVEEEFVDIQGGVDNIVFGNNFSGPGTDLKYVAGTNMLPIEFNGRSTVATFNSRDARARVEFEDDTGMCRVGTLAGKLLLEADPLDATADTKIGLRVDGVEKAKVDGNGLEAADGKFTASLTRGTSGWYTGSGTPEGSVTAVVGSIYTRTDGGSNTTLYVKESGTGNTGWVAK